MAGVRASRGDGGSGNVWASVPRVALPVVEGGPESGKVNAVRESWIVTYSKDVHKKKRKWMDGTVQVEAGEGILSDEDGQELYRWRIGRVNVEEHAEISTEQYAIQVDRREGGEEPAAASTSLLDRQDGLGRSTQNCLRRTGFSAPASSYKRPIGSPNAGAGGFVVRKRLHNDAPPSVPPPAKTMVSKAENRRGVTDPFLRLRTDEEIINEILIPSSTGSEEPKHVAPNTYTPPPLEVLSDKSNYDVKPLPPNDRSKSCHTPETLNDEIEDQMIDAKPLPTNDWSKSCHAPETLNYKVENQIIDATMGADKQQDSTRAPMKDLLRRLDFSRDEKYGGRHCQIPNMYKTIDDYIKRLSDAVEEEIQLMIAELARRYFGALDTNAGSSDVARKLRQAKLMPSNVGFDFNRNLPVNRSTKMFMTINDNIGPSTNYHLDDIWIVSPTLDFECVMLCRSLWHSPNKDGTIEVEILNCPTDLWATLTGEGAELSWKRKKRSPAEFYALQGPECRTEITTLAILNGYKGREKESELLHYMTQSGGQSKFKWKDQVSDSREFSMATSVPVLLNKGQQRAIARVSQWCDPLPREFECVPPPVCLVDGPFGTGKSHLLAAMILHILARYKEDGRHPRILVTGHTNNAVDRVLESLKKLGFDDFLRVGPIVKISKEILPYSIHSSSKAGNQSEVISELNAMLKSSSSLQEKRILEEELRCAKDGKTNDRLRQLKSSKVVATTCCSCVQEIFNDLSFDFCLQDECSQIIEPLSVLPLIRFNVRQFIAVGDPRQLAPVLAKPAITTKSGENQRVVPGLGRTLFDRLAKIQIQPCFLDTQYRCHPRIAAVCSSLFYRNQLVSGCTLEERAPLVPGLSPISFCDFDGKVSYGKNRSIENKTEAAVVAQIIKILLSYGLCASRMGVICVYKAQVDTVRDSLLEKQIPHSIHEFGEDASGAGDVRVSTVDAFQGAERDLIILTCSVNHRNQHIENKERFNVAVSRACNHLIVVGNRNALGESPLWSHLITKADYFPRLMPHPILNIRQKRGEFSSRMRDEKSLKDKAREVEPEKAREVEPEKAREVEPDKAIDLAIESIDLATEEPETVIIQGEPIASGEELTSDPRVRQILEMTEGGFGPDALWEGFKSYGIGYWYDDSDRKKAFHRSKLGEALHLYYNGIPKKLPEEFQWFYSNARLYVAEKFGKESVMFHSLIAAHDKREDLLGTPFGDHILEDADAELEQARNGTGLKSIEDICVPAQMPRLRDEDDDESDVIEEDNEVLHVE